jgi:simple sugar transport system permease protein
VLFSALSVLLGLLAGAVLIYVSFGKNPFAAYEVLFRSAYLNIGSMGESINIAAAIILTGLAFAFPHKANFWNIGMEGQLYVGGLLAAVVGYTISGLPFTIHLPLVLLAGFLGGVLAISIPTILKLRLGVNEILSTLLMNNIGMYCTFIFLFGPLSAGGMPFTPIIKHSARLPLVYGKMHSGIFVVVAVVLIMYFIYRKTVFGFRIRCVGLNPVASRYAGINTSRTVITAALMGGGFAGLAGAVQVAGVHYYMWEYISHGYGFFGVITAFLGRLDFVGIIFAGLLLGGLINGSQPMQALTGVSAELVTLLLGVIILIVVVMYSLRSKFFRR